ncbi:hypothetical protein OUZ56_007959 [Daphnia magna]|uniref:GMP synthase n=1 Tax=Daphnia magna TaxID=35525 RepID=A0ABR0ABU1_9CRUS|nr:hypothetical protein OUZ56_007959 [Daphnia magna]
MFKEKPKVGSSQADTHPQSHGVSEQCVESDILALETPGALLLQQGYIAIIISGGPNSVYAAERFTFVTHCYVVTRRYVREAVHHKEAVH